MDTCLFVSGGNCTAKSTSIWFLSLIRNQRSSSLCIRISVAWRIPGSTVSDS